MRKGSGSVLGFSGLGLCLRKVDARGVAKCFYSNQTCSAAGALGTDGYDALNRVFVITYSDSTPTEWFCYDGKYLVGTTCTDAGVPFAVGRLTSAGSVYGGRTILAYDPLGRVTADGQTTVLDEPPTAFEGYVFSYSYNRDGSLASQTYRSGRVVNFTYDGMGRPSSVQEPSGGPSYLNSVAYTAHGGIASMQLGNLLVEQTCYNDLLQPVARRLGDATSTNCAVQPSTDLLHLGFGYGTDPTANNGNMMQQTIWAPNNGSGSPWTVTQDYTYDAVNRPKTSAEKLGATPQWSQTYSYDHFGNRWVSGATGHTLHAATPISQSAIQATTNRLTGTGITYDNAGNLTAHPHITPGSGSMTYDANNKMKTSTATGVFVATLYDAQGRRMRKFYNGKTTIWVYDAFGNLAAEYTTETHTDEATYFRTTDHLGSTRLTSNEVGEVVTRRDYFPFGERLASTLSSRGTVLDGTLASFNANPGMRQQFTGQQRDDETGLDYFWERCLCTQAARFFSVDPGNSGAKYFDPQSWNGYAYSSNPLRYVDPSGRSFIDILRGIGSIFNGDADPQTLDPMDYMHLSMSMGHPPDAPFVFSIDPVYDALVANANILGSAQFSTECRDLLAKLDLTLDGTPINGGVNVDFLQSRITSIPFVPGNDETATFSQLNLAQYGYHPEETMANYFARSRVVDKNQNVFIGQPSGAIYYNANNSDLDAQLLQGTILHESLHVIFKIGDVEMAYAFGALGQGEAAKARYDAIKRGDSSLTRSERSSSNITLDSTCIPFGGFR